MYSFIDGDFFESLADFSFGDMYSNNNLELNFHNLKNIFSHNKEITVLFIETHRIGHLFQELINFPNRNVVIIAHNSDATFGQELIRYIPKNVKKIWCQNYNYIENDIIKSLPIGLERIRWFPEQKKQEVLNDFIKKDIERKDLVYMNFNPGTNKDRLKYFNELKDKDFISSNMIGNGGDYINYITNLKSHKYIISPPGNGIDCHRNWEALYLGCIPIVLKSNFCENIFSSLPVLIVDSYNDINKELLLNNFDNLKNKKTDEIYNEYWKKIINNI